MKGKEKIHIGKVENIPDGVFTILNLKKYSVGVIRIEEDFKAYLNVCPHAGAPICQGEVSRLVVSDQPFLSYDDSEIKVVRCPWHNYEYDLSTGQGILSDAGKLISIATEEINGELFLLI